MTQKLPPRKEALRKKGVCVAELSELLLVEFGTLLRAIYAELQQMSVKFSPPSAVSSSTSSSSHIFSLAGLAAECVVLQEGIDYENYVSGQRVIAKEEMQGSGMWPI